MYIYSVPGYICSAVTIVGAFSPAKLDAAHHTGSRVGDSGPKEVPLEPSVMGRWVPFFITSMMHPLVVCEGPLMKAGARCCVICYVVLALS